LTHTPISLQDLRRNIYIKARAERPFAINNRKRLAERKGETFIFLSFANLCPFSGRAEFARFGEHFRGAVGEPVEATTRGAVWQSSAEHL